jgi:hypothetical protein
VKNKNTARIHRGIFVFWGRSTQLVETGGQAKIVIQNGEVKVNGQNETRRGRPAIWRRTSWLYAIR